ncbi:GGDEF-domain containing protein [Acidisoma sp. C75]
MLTARYRALMPQGPVIVIAILGGMTAQIAAFAGSVPAVWSVLPPATILAGGFYILFYWLRHRSRLPEIGIIRRDMRKLSGLLIGAAVIAVLGDFKIMEATTTTGRYFLIMKLTFYGLFAQSVVFSIGRISFLYTVIICAATVFDALYFHVDYALPIVFMITVFATGVLTAMHRHLSGFDSLVFARAETTKLSEENARLARLDMLTNLPNRRHFFGSIGHRVTEATERGEKLAVGILDLDGFKPVNDSYGHFIGDRVLVEVARRLLTALPQSVAFYRLGGDEFAFHLLTGGDADELRCVGQTIIRMIEQPLVLTDLVIRVSGSIGIAVFPDMAQDTETLFEYADLALYHAKRTGRARTEIFSPTHKAELRAQSLIEQALRVADIEAEFFPVFQPIVHADDERTFAFELLTRWQSPLLGLVSPGDFVPVAERAGLISQITLIMLRRGIDVMRAWPETLSLSFNLSAYDIMSSETVARIIRTVEDSKYAAHRFTFEITETALLQDFATARGNLETLRAAGLGIALDDFGTGYSSLSHVQSLPLDKLKIDRRFVADIEQNPTSKMIVRSLVGLCKGIGISCVAEGAETTSQVQLLRDLGCDAIQGYVFARPMRAEAIAGYLTRELAAPSLSA